jgi:ATP/maltotriose-dependent transcriptional regulator MalT
MEFQFLEFLRSYGSAIALLASVIVLLLASKFVTKEHLAAQAGALEGRLKIAEGKVDAVEDRVTLVEKEMEHLPDKGSFHRMEISLVELKGQLAAMDEKLKPVARMADRLHEHMLDNQK